MGLFSKLSTTVFPEPRYSINIGLCHRISVNYEAGTCIIAKLQVRQLKPREVEQQAQGHRAIEMASPVPESLSWRGCSNLPAAADTTGPTESSLYLAGCLLYSHFPICYASGASGPWTDAARCRRRHQVLPVP